MQFPQISEWAEARGSAVVRGCGRRSPSRSTGATGRPTGRFSLPAGDARLEWLRRDPSYGAAALKAGSGSAACFGLVAFEPPERPAPDARPMWTAAADPHVLFARPFAGADQNGCFDVRRLRNIAHLRSSAAGEHLLLSDGLRSVRIDGPSGIFSGGPVGLEYSIAGLGLAGPPLLTLRRFLALCSTGRFSRMLHPLEPRARRWVLMLRAWDALQGGAGQREIAEVLLSRSAGEPRWRVREPSVRLQRSGWCARRGRWEGGYRHLLGHPRISGPELNERELVRRPRRQGLGQKEP